MRRDSSSQLCCLIRIVHAEREDVTGILHLDILVEAIEVLLDVENDFERAQFFGLVCLNQSQRLTAVERLVSEIDALRILLDTPEFVFDAIGVPIVHFVEDSECHFRRHGEV